MRADGTLRSSARAANDGELNCDGAIYFGDIDSFVLVPSATAGYGTACASCNCSTMRRGKQDADDVVNFDETRPSALALSDTGPLWTAPAEGAAIAARRWWSIQLSELNVVGAVSRFFGQKPLLTDLVRVLCSACRQGCTTFLQGRRNVSYYSTMT